MEPLELLTPPELLEPELPRIEPNKELNRPLAVLPSPSNCFLSHWRKLVNC